MFLSIDVGNTQTTIALFDEEGACTQQWRMASAPSDTSDSLHARQYSYFQMYGLSLADVEEKIPVSRRRVSALKKALGL